MAAQDPDGTTTYRLSANWSITRKASLRASEAKPELNRGCPQQVWSRGKSTSTPKFRRSRTVLTPTSGYNWSMMQVTKRETLTPEEEDKRQSFRGEWLGVAYQRHRMEATGGINRGLDSLAFCGGGR